MRYFNNFDAFMKLVLSMTGGFYNTLIIFFFTLLFSLPLGLAVALLRMSRRKIVSVPTSLYILVMRGTPLMLQLIIIFYGPGKWFDNNIWGNFSDGRMAACVVAFVINYACYFAVIYKGGIEGVPVGQREAGQVLGMTKSQIFFRVTLLQMVKRIVPPMSNEIITLVKDTSLASVIGTVEMFTRAKQIVASPNTPGMLALVAAGVFYYVFNYVVAFAMEKWEQALRYYR